MLCSISTPTSSKSGSNWLDRLRSSKGFPAADQLDLDQFLSNSTDAFPPESTSNQIDPNSSSSSAQQSHKPPAVLDRDQTANGSTNGDREWFGVMTNALSELFYMGDTDTTNHFSKKSCRKQPNPKICHLSTPPAGNEDVGFSGTLPSASRSIITQKEMRNQLQPTGMEEREEEERGNNADLSAFSRTEVTIIDTSYTSWKFDKMLFRRKNVWKVRDRKCKSMVPNKLKRKAILVNESANAAAEYMKPCSSYMVVNGEEGLAPTHGGHKQVYKREAACKQKSDVLIQVPEYRFPRKSKEGASSVVLIKSIPTSKKIEANIAKSCMKTMQKQYKA